MSLNLTAQKSKEALLAGGAILAAGFATYASNEQLKEGMEQQATEWYLTNHPEERLFRLKMRNFDITKFSDLSNVSCMLYTVYTYHLDSRKLKEKFVLLSFHSQGWINDQGVNFTKVSYYLLSQSQWADLIKLWVETISPTTIDWTQGLPEFKKCNEKKFIPDDPRYLKIENNIDGIRSTDFYEISNELQNYPIPLLRFSEKNIEVKIMDANTELVSSKSLIPLAKVDGDTYLRSSSKLSYLDSYLVGNEKTICIFKTDDQRLIQLNLDMVNYVQGIFD
jgi:hypothetical protein